MNARTLLQRAVRWLRAGHPEGGHVTALSVLRRELGDADIRQIADKLISQAVDTGRPITASDVTAMIRRVALQQATVQDRAAVTTELSARGWRVTAAPDDGS